MNSPSLLSNSLTPATKNWLIAASYFFLASLLTYPALPLAGRAIVGEPSRDALQHTWNLWWSQRALLTLQQSPAQVQFGWPLDLFHPLLFVTPFVEFAALPLTLAFGPMAAYNLHLIIVFALSGFTGYLLGYAVTGSRSAGVMAGLIFGFNAHRWSHVWAGHFPHLTVYMAPLFVWALWRCLQSPSRRRGLIVGLMAGLVALVHVMHAAYILLPVTVIVGWWGVFRFGSRAWWRQLIPAALWSVGPFLVLIGPFYGNFLASLGEVENNFQARGIVENAPDLLAFIIPPPTNPVLNQLHLVPDISRQIFADDSVRHEGVIYLGWASIILVVIAGLTLDRERRQPWLTIAIICGLLALGPYLKVADNLVRYQTDDLMSYIILPYAIITELPFLSWGRTTGRLSQTLMMGWAVLAAYGLREGVARLTDDRLARSGLLVMVAGLFVAESLVIFPLPQANPFRSAYYQTARFQIPSRDQTQFGSEEGGVLHLPLRSQPDINRAMFFQMFHQQPIVGGYAWRDFRGVAAYRAYVQLLFTPAEKLTGLGFPAPDNGTRLLALQSLKLQAIHIHRDQLDSFALQEQARLAEQLLGPPRYEDELLRVFAVPAGPGLTEPLLLYDPATWEITIKGAVLYLVPHDSPQLYLYAPQPVTQSWQFGTFPLAEPATLSFLLNHTIPYSTPITATEHLVTGPIPLSPGLNTLQATTPFSLSWQ